VLHRERLRLEAAIRRRTLRSAPARGGGAAGAFDAGALLDQLGSARLLKLVVADGGLHVLVCGDGRIRRLAAGAAAEAAREVDFARFGLNRIARGGLAEPAEQALAALAVAGRRLEALLLVLHRPRRVITPSHGRRTPGDGGASSVEVVSSTSLASVGMSAG